MASSDRQQPPNSSASDSDNTSVRDVLPGNHHCPIDKDDIVILVMGITRVGKSSFINKASGSKEIAINNDLTSQTRAVQPVRCFHPDGQRSVVLVDTPGFDDTCLSGVLILQIIAHWLNESYQKNIRPSGLLYLHRISDNRVGGASRRDIAVFKALCGEKNLMDVVLVTTMWDEVEDVSIGSEREKQLRSLFWKDWILRYRSRTCRFQGTRESAWEIIDCLDLKRSGQRRTPLQIQRDMVDHGLPFHETGAAKTFELHTPSTQDYVVARGVQSSNHRSSDVDIEDDIVIMVMGMTGAGKSSFIKTAAGSKDIAINNGLISQTRAIQSTQCLHPDGRRRVILVDTPGFDNTYLSDDQILKIIVHWLNETYQKNVKLSGLLYLHRISDRVRAATRRGIAMLNGLCGKNNLRNVVLVTTMWDEVGYDGPETENYLFSGLWEDTIRCGSRTGRFQGTRESAWEIIDCLDLEVPNQRRTPLQVQQEMVDHGLPFHETRAAKALELRPTQFFEKASILSKFYGCIRWKTDSKRPSTGHPSRDRPLPRVRATGAQSIANSEITSTSVNSAAEGTPSDCKMHHRQDALLVALRALELNREMTNVPMLRGIIGTALGIGQLILEMGGAHHVIAQVIEYSGQLLNEITQYGMQSELSKDLGKALSAFQRELGNLEKDVTRNLSKGRTRFFLHEADLQTITACITSIKAVHEQLSMRLVLDDHHAITQLEDQLTALWTNPTLRQCECGWLTVPNGEAQERE